MFWKELRFAARQLLRAPAFTSIAVLTLMLGVGGSAAVFTVFDSVILKPLSYPDSGRLVVLWERVKYLGSGYTGPNARHALLWQKRVSALSELALFRHSAGGVSINPTEHPRLIGGLRVTPNFLEILRVKPLMGRDFRPEDGQKGHEDVVILTFGLWQNLFHGEAEVIGKSLRLANVPYQIVGVLPESFRFPKRSVLSAFPSSQTRSGSPDIEVLRPMYVNGGDFSWNGDYGNLLTMARLKPNVSLKIAEAELNSAEDEILREMPANEKPSDLREALRVYVQPMQEAIVGGAQKGLALLLACVIGLVVMASVNLAHAQLARAIAREKEAALRSALGANRWQLLCGPIAESLLLLAAGGAGGLWLAGAGVAAFLRYTPVELPRMEEIGIDKQVLLFAFALMAASGLIFGLVPAVRLLRIDPQEALQSSGTRTHGSRKGREIRFWLIGLQVFACTALLIVTGLFAKNLSGLLKTEKGFDTDHTLVAEMTPSAASAKQQSQTLAAVDAALTKLRALPGVQSAGLVSAMPLEGETWINSTVRADRPQRNPPLANWRWVSPGYFQTIHQRLVAGRVFEERDRQGKTIVISQRTAAHVWPGENPVGMQIRWRDSQYTVIGIVADARNNSLKLPPANMVYFFYSDFPQYPLYFLVRSNRPVDQVAASMRQVIWDSDPGAVIARIKSLDTQLDDSLSSERFQTKLLIAFGIVALFLAAIGIYGVLSYTVATRKQEIGIRMALGATRVRINGAVLREAAAPVLAGLLAGCLASMAISRTLEALLYSTKSVDASVTAAALLLLLGVASVAAFWPAYRAASISPAEALRQE